MIRDPVARRIGHEPQVDPARVGGSLCIGLDGAAGLERGDARTGRVPTPSILPSNDERCGRGAVAARRCDSVPAR